MAAGPDPGEPEVIAIRQVPVRFAGEWADHIALSPLLCFPP
jgi:hypothetical protein